LFQREIGFGGKIERAKQGVKMGFHSRTWVYGSWEKIIPALISWE
jgi:hypothetical protein